MAGESYPSSQQWGSDGWTYRTLEDAVRRNLRSFPVSGRIESDERSGRGFDFPFHLTRTMREPSDRWPTSKHPKNCSDSAKKRSNARPSAPSASGQCRVRAGSPTNAFLSQRREFLCLKTAN
jgi:hypothetical protein